LSDSNAQKKSWEYRITLETAESQKTGLRKIRMLDQGVYEISETWDKKTSTWKIHNKAELKNAFPQANQAFLRTLEWQMLQDFEPSQETFFETQVRNFALNKPVVEPAAKDTLTHDQKNQLQVFKMIQRIYAHQKENAFDISAQAASLEKILKDLPTLTAKPFHFTSLETPADKQHFLAWFQLAQLLKKIKMPQAQSTYLEIMRKMNLSAQAWQRGLPQTKDLSFQVLAILMVLENPIAEHPAQILQFEKLAEQIEKIREAGDWQAIRLQIYCLEKTKVALEQLTDPKTSTRLDANTLGALKDKLAEVEALLPSVREKLILLKDQLPAEEAQYQEKTWLMERTELVLRNVNAEKAQKLLKLWKTHTRLSASEELLVARLALMNGDSQRMDTWVDKIAGSIDKTQWQFHLQLAQNYWQAGFTEKALAYIEKMRNKFEQFPYALYFELQLSTIKNADPALLEKLKALESFNASGILERARPFEKMLRENLEDVSVKDPSSLNDPQTLEKLSETLWVLSLLISLQTIPQGKKTHALRLGLMGLWLKTLKKIVLALPIQMQVGANRDFEKQWAQVIENPLLLCSEPKLRQKILQYLPESQVAVAESLMRALETLVSAENEMTPLLNEIPPQMSAIQEIAAWGEKMQQIHFANDNK
jgi:hypothetical protein